MKLTQVMLLLTTLACAASTCECAYAQDNQPVETVNFGTALQMFDLAIRRIMPCGYPPQNIPILAPYILPFYSFNLGNKYYKFTGNLSDLVVTGLNNFYFLDFSYNTTTNRTSYDILFTNVEFFGHYMFDFWAQTFGFPAQLSGKGLLEFKVYDFRLVGDFVMATSQYNPNGLRISDFTLHFYVSDVKCSCWDYNWNIAGNNFFNTWTRAFALMWVEQIQTKVDEIYAQLLLPKLNGYLDGVSMSQLINYFVEESMILNMANCTLTGQV